jgi:hypothetical protein
MNTKRLVVLALTAGGMIMSGCGSMQTPVPTTSPTPTIPPTLTPTASPTPKPTVTPTPLPPALRDGTDTWLVLGVSFVGTVQIEGYDRTAESGKAFLLIEFKSENQKYPIYPALPNSQKIDYSQIYVTDSRGNKYFAVGNGVQMNPVPGSSGFLPGNFAFWFEAMPLDSHGFTLYFSNLPPVELGK